MCLEVASIQLYFNSQFLLLMNTPYYKESRSTEQVALVDLEAFLPDSRQSCNVIAAVSQSHSYIQYQQMQGPACRSQVPLQQMGNKE